MTETKNYYTATRNHADHSTFGGEIDIKDFNTYSPNKKRISNQMELIKEKQTIDLIKRSKKMTLEELKKIKLVSNTDGRPSNNLTDEKWQKEFRLRKLFVKPYASNITKIKGLYSRESGVWNEEVRGVYDGCTNWMEYCKYINDVLENIRSGQIDYCYYIYQILDLTRFHYNTLKTKYCDGYWEVWLDR